MTTLPTFHLNGSSPQTLKDEYKTALEAVSKVFDTVTVATCHPRDFYLTDGAWEQAKSERDEVLRKLHDVIEYLTAWHFHALKHCR